MQIAIGAADVTALVSTMFTPKIFLTIVKNQVLGGAHGCTTWSVKLIIEGSQNR